MAQQYVLQQSFTGGLNVRDKAHMIGDNQASLLENFEIRSDGGLVKRAGQAKYNSSAIGSNSVHSLFRYYKSATTFKEFLAGCGTALYKGNDGTGVWTSIQTGLADARMYFQTWNDIVYIFNGTDKLQYNGTTVSAISGSPPAATFVVLHKERLYIAGVTTNPNRLYFCETGDPTTWNTSTNYIDIDSDDGDKITGLAPINGMLAIFKENGIFMLQGYNSDTHAWQRVTTNTGCVAQRSVAMHNQLIYFQSSDGVYKFNGNSTLKISGFVDPEFDSIPANVLVDGVGVVHREQYWLCASYGAGPNSKTMVYDIKSGGWTKYTGTSFSSLAAWGNTADGWELYGGDSTATGFVRELDTGTDDDGVNITAKFEGRQHYIEGLRSGTIKTALLMGESGSATPSLSLIGDYGKQSRTSLIDLSGAGDSLWDTMVWGTDGWSMASVEVIKKRIIGMTVSVLLVSLYESSQNALALFGAGFGYNPAPQNYEDFK